MFTPQSKTVSVGSTVQWAWNSCTGDGYGGDVCVAHSVTFDDDDGSGTRASPVQDHGTFARTFDTPGVYAYHCSVHGYLGMTGTITVQ
jgi:plastocyanin